MLQLTKQAFGHLIIYIPGIDLIAEGTLWGGQHPMGNLGGGVGWALPQTHT